jgi:RNA polymerase-associated protein
MQWWTAEPIIYTKDDLEGHRIRFMIAEKRARCGTHIINVLNPAPEFLSRVNPKGVYPVAVDKNLICFGAALDELLHERFPAPMLLPNDPIRRAQMRMLADEVRSWYSFSASALAEKLREACESYDGTTRFFTADSISIVDIALAPVLYTVPHHFFEFAMETPFWSYRERLLSRQAFQQSLRAQSPCNEMEWCAVVEEDLEPA